MALTAKLSSVFRYLESIRDIPNFNSAVAARVDSFSKFIGKAQTDLDDFAACNTMIAESDLLTQDMKHRLSELLESRLHIDTDADDDGSPITKQSAIAIERYLTTELIDVLEAAETTPYVRVQAVIDHLQKVLGYLYWDTDTRKRVTALVSLYSNKRISEGGLKRIFDDLGTQMKEKRNKRRHLQPLMRTYPDNPSLVQSLFHIDVEFVSSKFSKETIEERMMLVAARNNNKILRNVEDKDDFGSGASSGFGAPKGVSTALMTRPHASLQPHQVLQNQIAQQSAQFFMQQFVQQMQPHMVQHMFQSMCSNTTNRRRTHDTASGDCPLTYPPTNKRRLDEHALSETHHDLDVGEGASDLENPGGHSNPVDLATAIASECEDDENDSDDIIDRMMKAPPTKATPKSKAACLPTSAKTRGSNSKGSASKGSALPSTVSKSKGSASKGSALPSTCSKSKGSASKGSSKGSASTPTKLSKTTTNFIGKVKVMWSESKNAWRLWPDPSKPSQERVRRSEAEIHEFVNGMKK